MATSAFIYVERSEHLYEGISVHWDGTLNHTGAILLKYYFTIDKINNLIKLGDLSEINTNTDTCVAYHRDKNESWSLSKPNFYDDEVFFNFVINENRIVFLFQNNKWYWSNDEVRHNQTDIFTLLEDADCGLTKRDFDPLERPVANQEEFFESFRMPKLKDSCKKIVLKKDDCFIVKIPIEQGEVYDEEYPSNWIDGTTIPVGEYRILGFDKYNTVYFTDETDDVQIYRADVEEFLQSIDNVNANITNAEEFFENIHIPKLNNIKTYQQFHAKI